MCVQRTCYEQVQKVFAELLMDQGVPNFHHNIHIVVFVSHLLFLQLANTAYNVILSFPTLQFQRFVVFSILRHSLDSTVRQMYLFILAKLVKGIPLRHSNSVDKS